MLKKLHDKKTRKRKSDLRAYYGNPGGTYLSPYEYRTVYPGPGIAASPQLYPHDKWANEGVQRQMHPFDDTLAYQPYYHNQFYQQPSQNPYFMEQNPGTMPVIGGMSDVQSYYGAPPQEMLNHYPKKHVNPFQNPLYSQDEDFYPSQQANTAITHPYPKQNFMQKNQGNNFSSVLNQFKTQEGSIDLNKMIDTAGMMLNSVNQVSNIVKGVGSIFKVTT